MFGLGLPKNIIYHKNWFMLLENTDEYNHCIIDFEKSFDKDVIRGIMECRGMPLKLIRHINSSVG